MRKSKASAAPSPTSHDFRWATAGGSRAGSESGRQDGALFPTHPHSLPRPYGIGPAPALGPELREERVDRESSRIYPSCALCPHPYQQISGVAAPAGEGSGLPSAPQGRVWPGPQEVGGGVPSLSSGHYGEGLRVLSFRVPFSLRPILTLTLHGQSHGRGSSRKVGHCTGSEVPAPPSSLKLWWSELLSSHGKRGANSRLREVRPLPWGHTASQRNTVFPARDTPYPNPLLF